MTGRAELVKLCSISHVLPAYNCDTGEMIKEVVVINTHGEVIPHDSTVYTAPAGTFIGDGSGFIRSYFTDAQGNAIADTDRPVSWSYDPSCGVVEIPDIELGCFYNPNDPASDPIPGYFLCVTTIDGEGSEACDLGPVNNTATGDANDGYFGMGDPGSGLPGIVRFIKVGGATDTAIAAAIASGDSVIEFTVDGTETYRVFAADLTAPADNASGVWVVSDATADPCGLRILWPAEDQIDTSVVIDSFNFDVNGAGGGTPTVTCSYYDADGNPVEPSENLIWDTNCDRFDYEEIGPLCVKNGPNQNTLVATVKQVSVYDTQDSNNGTNQAVLTYYINLADGTIYTPVVGDVIGPCSSDTPLVQYGCLYRADGSSLQVWQEIAAQGSSFQYGAPVYYTAPVTGGGVPVTLLADDEFEPGACRITCALCQPLS